MEQDPGKTRLDELGRQLDELNKSREVQKVKRENARMSSGGAALGMRVVTELLAGVLGGLAMGWLLDSWFGTEPWLLILMLTLGMVAAFRNVFKLASRSPKQTDSSADEDKG